MSDLNQSAIRKHALVCSEKNRGGRFTRTGQDFIDEVNADIEALVRDIRNNRFPISVGAALMPNESFVTGALLEKLREALNLAVGRLIQAKVQRLPSVGKTLGRTY